MTIWVDADSCPKRVRDIVARAAEKRDVAAVFVANRAIHTPPTVSFIEVSESPEAADRYLVEHAETGDLAVTRDIPLAAELVDSGLIVLNDRGDVYSTENVRERLSIRDFMKELRSRGEYEMPGRGYSNREVQAFAAAFDRELTRCLDLK